MTALSLAADSVESDAYTIQSRAIRAAAGPRPPLPDRDARLQNVKDISARPVPPDIGRGGAPVAPPPTADQAWASAADGSARAPYPPSVSNALAMAALAALGAAGDNARANTDALSVRPRQPGLPGQFQAEPVPVPGRRRVRAMRTCSASAVTSCAIWRPARAARPCPPAIVTVGNPTQSGAPVGAPVSPSATRTPSIRPEPLSPAGSAVDRPLTQSPPPPAIRTAPVQTAPVSAAPVRPTLSPDQSATQRLNTGPNRLSSPWRRRVEHRPTD